MIDLPPGRVAGPGGSGTTAGRLCWLPADSGSTAGGRSDTALLASMGITGMVPHGLRHTAAYLAISSGAITVVQKMLGHKTATLTLDLYGHVLPDDLDSVAAAMDAGAMSAADQLRTQWAESGGDDQADTGLPAIS